MITGIVEFCNKLFIDLLELSSGFFDFIQQSVKVPLIGNVSIYSILFTSILWIVLGIWISKFIL